MKVILKLTNDCRLKLPDAVLNTLHASRDSLISVIFHPDNSSEIDGCAERVDNRNCIALQPRIIELYGLRDDQILTCWIHKNNLHISKGLVWENHENEENSTITSIENERVHISITANAQPQGIVVYEAKLHFEPLQHMGASGPLEMSAILHTKQPGQLMPDIAELQRKAINMLMQKTAKTLRNLETDTEVFRHINDMLYVME